MDGFWRIVGLVVIFLMGGAPLQAQVEGGTIGEVTGRTTPAQVTRIIVDSPSEELKRLAQHAFNLHGGFELRSAGRVSFDLDFLPAGTAAVDLVISARGQELLRQRFAGRTLGEAFARAADLAVQRITNRPGWFSGSIAFVGERTGHPEVYVSDLLLQRPSQLTHDRSKSILPALSPDGRQLIYTGYFRNGFPDLYTIDLATHERSVFASFQGMNTGASYSADGRRVAMILSGSGNAEIYSANAMGGQFQRLTRTRAIEADPSWSPDGRRLVFTSDELGRPQIFVMNADGSGRRRLPTNVSRNCSEPDWNPVEPSTIAFSAAVGSEFEICLYTIGGGDARILTRGPGDVVHPVWLPDGRHLLVTLRSASSSRLGVLDSATGRTVPLTPAAWGRCSMPNFARGALP